MPISPPQNPRLGQVYQEAGTTYTWIGTTWVETIPSTSPPFPTIQDITFFSEGPTGPAGHIGPTGPSGGPIGPTGYTGYTGPTPDFSVSYGPDNGLIGSINYDVNAGVNDTSLGGMWATNVSTNFRDAFGRLSIGDTYTAKLYYPNGNSTIKSLTLASIPVGSSSYWEWSTYENDHDLIGDYGLIYLNSLQGKPGPTGPVGPSGLLGHGDTMISSNLIPATGNLYSIGNSTAWFKDVWLSANTLYVGGVPISTAGGQLSLPSVSINNPKAKFGGRIGNSGDISYLFDSQNNNLPYMQIAIIDPVTDFENAISKIKIGDRFTAAFFVDLSHTPEYVFTFQTLPVKTTYSGFSVYKWYVKENNANITGAYDYIILDSLNALNIGNTAITASGGGLNVPNLNVSGALTSNLIPAVGNTYSLGSSTSWFKDIWISANTFYVGGKPISVTANGQISIGDLVVTGSINGAAVNNVLNPVSGEPLITYNYTFDATLTDWNVYSGNRSVPDGKFIILGVGWPERPGVSLFGSNGTSGGYVNYMKMSGKTSDGKDIYQELKDKFAEAQSPNPRYTFIRLTEAGNPGNYSVFYWGGSLTSHDSSRTFEFAVTYIAGTASSDVWTSSNTQIIVEFSQKTMHGRIPLMDAQKYWWTKPHFFGPGFDMAVPYCAPLCCSGLWLYPPASNTGTVNFPTGNVWVGKSVTVWVFGNSLAKSNLVNVRTTSLPTTITANSFFNITYLDNNLKWAVTYQGNI